MKQVGNTILAKGVNHILAKRDNSAWPKGAKLSGFSNDQVIGFIRKQEQDILRPMLEAITTTEERIKANIGSLATSDKLIEFIQAVDSNSNIQVDTRDKLAETISKQNKEVKQAILTLARYLDEKGKAGLIDRLFG